MFNKRQTPTDLENRIHFLQKQNKKLNEQKNELEYNYQILSEDYSTLNKQYNKLIKKSLEFKFKEEEK